VVRGRDVVHVELLVRLVEPEQYRVHAVRHEHVGLGLAAVAQDFQLAAFRRLELLQEVERRTVCASRPHHVAEAVDVALDAEAFRIGAHQRFTRELAGAVERDRQVPEVHLRAESGRVAIHGARRGEHQASRLRAVHGLEHVPGRDRALFEIEPGVIQSPARLGVSGEMEDDVVTAHRFGERVQIRQLVDDQLAGTGFEMLADELALADAQVVVDGHRTALDQPIDQVAADEASAACDEVARLLAVVAHVAGIVIRRCRFGKNDRAT